MSSMISCAVIGIFNSMKPKVRFSLELDSDVVAKLEALTETNIKCLLESELSDGNVDVFIEKMGYDNY